MDKADIQVTRFVKMTPHNLRALLYDLGIREPGFYPSARLYSRYVEMCADVDAVPVSKNSFGRSLTNQGYTGFIRSIDGKNVRCWQFGRSIVPEPGYRPPTELDPDSTHPKIGDPDYRQPEPVRLEPDLWEG